MAASNTAPAQLDGAWYGFLLMVFAVVGLAGIFGTYASQIPYLRGEAAEQVLDRAALARTPADLATLKDDLGDNTAILARTDLPLSQRITEARAATRARTARDAADFATRARVVIGVITCGSALFGCMLLGTAAHQRARKPAEN